MPKYGKFRTRILAQKEREENAPVYANITKDIKPMAKRNMGVKFTPKTGPNAGEEVMFRMPPFPRNLSEKQEEKLNEPLKAAIKAKLAKTNNTRVTEDEDSGMLRMEELQPLNRMGTVPLMRNEMPMAYKQKVVKKTAAAKAIPFTAK